MLRICRAEDGEVFQVNGTVRDIERLGSLEFFLHQETGVDQEAILAYLSDGRRLRNDNIRELAVGQDQSIFVFNKYYLDYDLDEVLRELKAEPLLQPPIEDSIAATPPFRPSQLAASYLRTAHAHHDAVNHTLLTLRCQHEAVRIASSSLDLNVLLITDASEGVASSARAELDKQAALLAGLEADLDLIGRIRIHVEFMSPSVRRAIEGGEKPRTLGDYVSIVKMRQVAETCSRTHDELRSTFQQTEQAISRLTEGAGLVRSTVTDRHLLNDAELCVRRSKDVFDKITDTAGTLESPASNSDVLLQDLRQFDQLLRDELKFITDVKNEYTEQYIGALRRISTLNDDLVQLPSMLTALQSNLRGKNSFSHIRRLHNMLYAYGATIIEIVRRKEFTRFFYQRAQSILEVMAKVSFNERKRRQIYRGEVHGQLPFDTKGMDEPVPVIDFSPSGNVDSPYSLERGDVEGFLRVMDDLEQYTLSSNDPVALNAVREARIALDKLVWRMDSLESAFDRIAEKSLLSASRLSASRRRFSEADEQAYQDLIDQLRDTQQALSHKESAFEQERNALQDEIHRLKSTVRELDATVASEQERADRLERDLHHVRSQAEHEATTRKIIEGRDAELLADVEHQRQLLSTALADATDQTKVAELLRQELAQVRAQFEDVKALEERKAAKVASLLEEQAGNLRKLEEARARGENLESQIQSARSECGEVHRALQEAGKEKDRLLRAQASEHDRIMRDHIAEADGDRAVLEHRFSELRAIHENTERQLKDVRAQMEVANADAVGLREELQRVEHELREARHVERVLRDDLRTGRASQSDYEQRLENDSRLIAQILDVAIAFRNSHVKALHMAQAVTSHPNATTRSAGHMGDSVFSTALRHGVIGPHDEPSPIDPSDPVTALEVLRSFDHDHFLEALGKTGSTIKKWQKQCKEYRERAKGKISFRNFAKGDLALFLPTRNSVSKPWAAFNVSFPHYFLQAVGHLADQLKTREWIVARITSITERVVNQNDPSSNPYGLSDGIKYYMLEVEDWTQPTQPHKRRAASKKTDKTSKEPSPPPAPTLDINPVPPQPEVEDTFRLTRSPTSHFFPARSRSNSSPTAGPSSLSRLLAQAPVEPALEPVLQSRSTSTSPVSLSGLLPPLSPTRTSAAPHGHAPSVSSPLRPGSRASRISSSSKFSVSRMPPLGSASSVTSATAKTAPTIALSDAQISGALSSSPGEGQTIARPSTPSSSSPNGSLSEGMSNLLLNRRRTTSYHIPRTSPLVAAGTHAERPASPGIGVSATGTLASLASSWGVSFGRKKKAELRDLAANAASASAANTHASGGDGTSSPVDEPSGSDVPRRL